MVNFIFTTNSIKDTYMLCSSAFCLFQWADMLWLRSELKSLNEPCFTRHKRCFQIYDPTLAFVSSLSTIWIFPEHPHTKTKSGYLLTWSLIRSGVTGPSSPLRPPLRPHSEGVVCCICLLCIDLALNRNNTETNDIQHETWQVSLVTHTERCTHCIRVIYHDLITVSLLRDGTILNYTHKPILFVASMFYTENSKPFKNVICFCSPKICCSSHPWSFRV